MNCFYHPEQPAVAQCSGCGKGLCLSCASRFSSPACKTCFNRGINFARSEIVKELLITFGLGLALTFCLLKGNIIKIDFSERPSDAIVMILILFYTTSGIVAGWQTLTRITPSIFLFLPIIGWILYFSLKLVLSFYVGLVMLPVRTTRNIFKLAKLKTVN
jgi:hypothetical protein